MKATREMGIAQSTPERLAARLTAGWPLVLLCLGAGLLLLWKLGAASLDDWDEAIYAQVSKEMVQNHRWLTPYWEYKPFFEKPPLFMWATALLYELFGAGELWARAASALSGVGLLAITYLIGRRLYDKSVALVSAAILLTSFQFVASARFGTTDTMLTLFIYLAIYGALRLEGGSPRWWYVIWIACGFAVMTKSVSGLVAPAAIGLDLLLAGRLSTAVRPKAFWGGLLSALLIVAPWHLWMIALHGRAFVGEYVGHHVIARSLSALNEHAGTRLYYIDRLHKYFFPWVYLAPVALMLGIGESIKGGRRPRLLLILTLLVFVIYTISQTKLRWYVLPIYPALSLLTASMVLQAARSHESPAFSGLVLAALAFMLVAPPPVALALAGFALMATLFFTLTGSLPHKAAVMITLGFFLVAGLMRLGPLYQGGQTPVARLARVAGEAGREPSTPLIVYSGLFQPAALFYGGRQVQVAHTVEDLNDFAADRQAKEIIMAKAEIDSLTPVFDVQSIREDGPLVYATIRLRGAK
jgi:4-amino-4-deoxy-L-arabinose transferase-like glycosyltransferase